MLPKISSTFTIIPLCDRSLELLPRCKHEVKGTQPLILSMRKSEDNFPLQSLDDGCIPWNTIGERVINVHAKGDIQGRLPLAIHLDMVQGVGVGSDKMRFRVVIHLADMD